MKTLPLLLSFGALIALLFVGIHQYGGTQPTEELEELVVTFDGYEGGHYIFSKEDYKAVLLSEDDELPMNAFDLANGDYVGKKFTIKIIK